MLCSFKGVFRRILAVRGCGIRHRSGQTAFGRPIDRTRPGRRRGEKEKSSKNARSGAVSRPGASVDRQSNAVKRTFPATIARFSPFVQKMFHVKHFASVLSERRVEYTRNGRFSLLFVSRETFFCICPEKRPAKRAAAFAGKNLRASPFLRMETRFSVPDLSLFWGDCRSKKVSAGAMWWRLGQSANEERGVWNSKKRPGGGKKRRNGGRIARNGRKNGKNNGGARPVRSLPCEGKRGVHLSRSV